MDIASRDTILRLGCRLAHPAFRHRVVGDEP